MALNELWLQEKYISQLGTRLKLFHRVKHNCWGFRCPICLDSKKNEYKTRGGIYLPPRATAYNYGCYNCGASMSFSNFLKLQDPFLYNEYSLERFQLKKDSEYKTEVPKVEVKEPPKKLSFVGMESIDSLPDDHPAIKYLKNRKIPKDAYKKLFFVLRFKKFEFTWRNVKVKDKIEGEHSRLIIPFFDKQGNIIRLSARAFGKQDPKYIFMKIKDDASRIFGLDTVNPKKTVFVLEGPLDSLFLENSIAVGSADLIVPELSSYKDVVLIPDNQPRNPEVCKSIHKMVLSGMKVCLWEKDWGKDINEMVMNGHSIEDIQDLISKSTYQGIAAQLKFKMWIKVRLPK